MVGMRCGGGDLSRDDIYIYVVGEGISVPNVIWRYVDKS